MAEDVKSLCVICQNTIPTGAKKCTLCGSFQNAFRRLLTGFDLKSLVALLPVAALVVVFLKDEFTIHQSELHITSLACQNGKIRVVASNLGDRAAVLAGARLFHVRPDGTLAEGKPLSRESKSKSHPLIKAGDTEIFQFLTMTEAGRSYTVTPPLTNSSPCAYKLRADIVGFDHVAKAPEEICACIGLPPENWSSPDVRIGLA
jgi:hypothetical protein